VRSGDLSTRTTYLPDQLRSHAKVTCKQGVTSPVHNEASDAVALGAAVHILGPADVDVTLTPTAALETARRVGDAAIEVLIKKANFAPTTGE
jgi:hypothetical protein